jgi:hypothetical protein
MHWGGRRIAIFVVEKLLLGGSKNDIQILITLFQLKFQFDNVPKKRKKKKEKDI